MTYSIGEKRYISQRFSLGRHGKSHGTLAIGPGGKATSITINGPWRMGH
ncbi:hypothetical protein D082_03930 [Synechocystis sp. PCC 6714]|nr:hypothetical protein D082_03930 [Synechocystis sp. PCC 6714]